MKALSSKILQKAPQSWKVRYFLALALVTSLSIIWIRYVESMVSLSALLYPEPESALEVLASWVQSPRGFEFLKDTSIYFSFMMSVHFLARVLWKTMGKEKYYSFNVYDRFALSEKIPSMIHGLVCGFVSFYLVFWTRSFSSPGFSFTDTFPPMLDWFASFSCGYEVYDLVIMLLQGDDSIIMWIHHSILIAGFVLLMSYKKFAFVLAVMMVTELTVVPSNLHWYLKIFGFKDTRVFHFNQGLRLWSFVALRLTTPPYIFYHLYRSIDLVFQQPALIRYALYVIVSLLSLMNVYWTAAMFVLYRKRIPLRKKREMMNRHLRSPIVEQTD